MAPRLCRSVTSLGVEVYDRTWREIGEYGSGVERNQNHRQDLLLGIGIGLVPLHSFRAAGVAIAGVFRPVYVHFDTPIPGVVGWCQYATRCQDSCTLTAQPLYQL